MIITGTSSIVGVLTLEVIDPLLRAPYSLSLQNGSVLDVSDELRFAGPIIDAVNRGLITISLESEDNASQSDVSAAVYQPYVEQTVIGTTTTLNSLASTGDTIVVKNSTSGNTTVAGGGKLIEDDSSITLIAGEAVKLRFNGVKWLIIGLGDTISYLEQWATPPASNNATGIKGQFAYSASGPYLFICVETNTWIRINATATFTFP